MNQASKRGIVIALEILYNLNQLSLFGRQICQLCDVVKEKTFVNNTQQRCLDFVVLNDLANSVEIQNPIYHELRVNDLMSINIEKPITSCLYRPQCITTLLVLLAGSRYVKFPKPLLAWHVQALII